MSQVVKVPALPALVVGTVRHVRHRPRDYAFEHAHYQWLVDVDELPALAAPLRTLARFDPRDHLYGGRHGGIGADLRHWLADQGVTLPPTTRILMLAHARSVGHVFNPLTVFWCLDADGAIRATVMEVHNTYGQRHLYLLETDAAGRARTGKEFYVSPFNDMEGTYAVRLRLDAARVHVSVTLHRDHQPVLTAVVAGAVRPGTSAMVAKVFAKHLFMTYRVSVLIRWHGIRLWLTRLPIQPRPNRTQEFVP